MHSEKPVFILASGSPRRLDLLRQIGLEPDHILPTNIDESPLKSELAPELARRLAQQKRDAAWAEIKEIHTNAVVLSADTVVTCGRRILPKAANADEAHHFLRLLSGRSHRVWSGIAVASAKGVWAKRVETRVTFARLHPGQIKAYVQTGEWEGKAGAYAIQGRAALFVQALHGSYSNVVGLPLRETAHLLQAAGLPVLGAVTD